MNEKIRVLIADDHAIVRQGLKQILSETEDLLVAGEADDGAEALLLARSQEWDVFLLDVAMPNRNGIDTLKQLKKEFPKLPVLILSMHPEDQYAVRAIQAGAAGYLTKQSAPAELVAAIRKVAGGEKYISPTLAARLAEVIAGGDRAGFEKLSDREHEVLRLIASGKTLTQVAEELNISVATVSTYRARLLEKLGLSNTAELIRYGLENGLVA
ncbi:MAG TPA: response regulator transcription factor [Rhodocyclaceae bacterium]